MALIPELPFSNSAGSKAPIPVPLLCSMQCGKPPIAYLAYSNSVLEQKQLAGNLPSSGASICPPDEATLTLGPPALVSKSPESQPILNWFADVSLISSLSKSPPPPKIAKLRACFSLRGTSAGVRD